MTPNNKKPSLVRTSMIGSVLIVINSITMIEKIALNVNNQKKKSKVITSKKKTYKINNNKTIIIKPLKCMEKNHLLMITTNGIPQLMGLNQ